MCKPWPGLRCTDHPHQKIQKYAARIHAQEIELSNATNMLQASFNEYGDDADKQEDHIALTKRVENIKTAINELEEKKRYEENNYAMSAGGRAKLEEMSNDETLTKDQRTSAAAELAIALKRIETQKEIGRVLKDPELETKDKLVYLQMVERMQEQSMTELNRQSDEYARYMEAYKTEVNIAKANGDKERVAEYNKKIQELAALKVVLDKELSHRESLLKDVIKFRREKERAWEANWMKVSRGLFKTSRIIEWAFRDKSKGKGANKGGLISAISGAGGGMGGMGGGMGGARGMSRAGKKPRDPNKPTGADYKNAEKNRKRQVENQMSTAGQDDKTYFDFDGLPNEPKQETTQETETLN